MRLGGELKRERRVRKMDQVAAAAAMKVSQQTVSKWENGGRPDVKHLQAIADFLRRDVDAVAVLAYSQADPMPAPEEGRLEALEVELKGVHEELRALRTDVGRLLDALAPPGSRGRR